MSRDADLLKALSYRAEQAAKLAERYRVIALALILAFILTAVYSLEHFGSSDPTSRIVGNFLINIGSSIIIYLAVRYHYKEAANRISSAYSDKIAPDADSTNSSGSESGNSWNLTSMEAFFQQIDFSTVKKIRVIAITGETTLKGLISVLSRHEKNSALSSTLSLEVLLRSDESSDSKRMTKRSGAEADIKRLSRVSCEIRYYSNVSPFCGIILYHEGATASSFLTFYDWRSARRETAIPERLCQYSKPLASDPLITTYISWFDHYWGNGTIHTIIFDFDDTLFLTTDAQVDGWLASLKKLVELHGKRILVEDIAKALQNGGNVLKEKLTTIFLDEQQEERILRRLIKTQVNEEQLAIIRQTRTQVRNQLTVNSAVPITDVIDQLRILAEKYTLAIISATSEETINAVLSKHHISHFFPYVFGREARHTWTNIESKSPQFVRMSNMIGVPFDRMVFIGDSFADFRTAGQLGLIFVENRHNALKYNRDTLIKRETASPYHGRFDGRYKIDGKNRDLTAVMAQIEVNKIK